jgi:delta24-sterol reductase
MFTDVGMYYTPAFIFRGEEFNGVEVVHRLEKWLIENHSYQPQYMVTRAEREGLLAHDIRDASHYELSLLKYGVVGTFMSVYYKSQERAQDREGGAGGQGRHA